MDKKDLAGRKVFEFVSNERLAAEYGITDGMPPLFVIAVSQYVAEAAFMRFFKLPYNLVSACQQVAFEEIGDSTAVFDVRTVDVPPEEL